MVDEPRIESAIKEILCAIGENPDREGLKGTPRRVAKSYVEIFSGIGQDSSDLLNTTFDMNHGELVLIKDIPFYSICEHHLLPFHGSAHVGYIPSKEGKVAGLSTIARLIELYAHRLQVQERLTCQIADDLMNSLDAQGIIVVVDAEHLCMSMRGVKKPGAKTVTSAVRGQLRQTATRAEAMSLILNS